MQLRADREVRRQCSRRVLQLGAEEARCAITAARKRRIVAVERAAVLRKVQRERAVAVRAVNVLDKLFPERAALALGQILLRNLLAGRDGVSGPNLPPGSTL